MTRRRVLSETLKLTGLLCGGVGLLAGCGGSDTTSSDQATPSDARKAELEAANAASGAASASSKAAKKK